MTESILNMNNSVTFDKGFWKSFGWFLLIALAICCLPWILAKNSWWIDFTDTGQIGDTIGGIMGPFVAIAAAGLTFIAFWVQYKANIQQRHDIAIERFESNLFEMIHIQQEITNGLVLEYNNKGNQLVVKHGREVFSCLYEEMETRYTYRGGSEISTLKKALAADGDLKSHLFVVRPLWFLDHYFRHLYRIFKYIDEGGDKLIDEDKKHEYAAIVRATLSPYELVLLYYNGFSHPRFQTLIEKFALLNNLRWKLLADVDEVQNVFEVFERNYLKSDESDKDKGKDYQESAFVNHKDERFVSG